jgi:hypothetical protein
MDQSGSTTEVIFVPPELRNGLPPRYTAALTSAVNLVLTVVARGPLNSVRACAFRQCVQCMKGLMGIPSAY